MSSIFTKIIEGELPAHFVWRDDKCVAFLDIRPITPGHCLVIPVQEEDHWLDLDPETNMHIMKVAQTIGEALRQIFSPPRVVMMIAGFEVPHTHLHVLCAKDMSDMDFANAREADNDELSDLAIQIKALLPQP